ncbi:putative thioesterase [Desulfosporosinus meridiei DSM 13257]|uniref:Putative thioesterase n=1 Tax=Desulfosporosinus meridiei (strain ATCC BAA-275 / DSM 13257 / KCTC 12902 / NCIMB 13706 / S10) TaxID=768704 RepID=J7IM34_DESMD|nr:acyl-CoA thioesterase [Desulfosporosinus meridiei]AFQ42817.1 putative thioesterase [Desulfosporosinus meridiei DSM 13257]
MDLKDFPVQVKIPIAWGEMDSYGHVNNIYYLRYFESSRIQYFQEIGMNELKSQTGIGPILAQTTCKYLKPLSYPDLITVGAKVKSIGKSSFVMEYVIVSDKMGVVVAAGEGVIVIYDYNASVKADIPMEIKESIARIEKMNLN